MHRAAVTLLLCALLLPLLVSCSGDPSPTAPTTAAADKRPPVIYDPPPGFDPFLASLAARFASTQWVEVPLTLNLAGGTVTAQPAGYAPIEVDYTADPGSAAAAAGGEWKCTLYLPAAPASGTLWTPGDCMIYRTKGFPPASEGLIKLRLPIMDFYDQSSYNGTFVSYSLTTNLEGFTAAADIQTIVLPVWPVPGPDPVVYVEVLGIKDKDEPSSATDRVLDPVVLGDEE